MEPRSISSQTNARLVVNAMSDELDDAVRQHATRMHAAQMVEQAQREASAAEALQWLQSLLRWSLIGYGAWLWFGWRGMVAALAAYASAERAVVWAGWLIHTGRSAR